MAMRTASSLSDEKVQRQTETHDFPYSRPDPLTHLHGPRELDFRLGPVGDLLSVVVTVRNIHAADVPQLGVENFKAPMERGSWLAHIRVLGEPWMHEASV